MRKLLTNQALYFTYLIITFACISQATDPNILSDFIVPPNITKLDANFFTFTGFRKIYNTTQFPSNFTSTKGNLLEFPALNGQSISFLIVQFPVGSMNPPHTHPRASELVYVLLGSLEVGFVDTNNKLYTQTLKLGDIFVVPKGLVHYQYNNANAKEPAVALTAFGSANGGKVTLPVNLFGSGIDDTVLAQSFKIDVETVRKIKAGFVA